MGGWAAEGSGACLCVSSLRAVSQQCWPTPHPEWGLSPWARGPGWSLGSPSPPVPTQTPSFRHPSFPGWTQARGRHSGQWGEGRVQAGLSAPEHPPTPSAGACSPHRGHHLEQGGFPTSARSRRTRPAILSPHTAGALPFTHPEREENARGRVLCRVSVFIEDDLSADFHRASVANPRHGTPAGFEEPGTVSVWHVQPRLPGGLNLPGKGGGAWL